MNHRNLLCLAAAACGTLSAVASADVTLSFTSNTVAQSSAATLTLLATSDSNENVRGFEFFGTVSGAAGVTDLGIPSGSIFHSLGENRDYDELRGSDEEMPAYSFFNSGENVSVSGVVASITVDTSQVPVGQTFSIDLFDSPGGGLFLSSFSGTPAVFTNDAAPFTFTVTSVPEPASAGLAALLGTGLLARRRRAVG